MAREASSSVGDRIKSERERLGLSQKALGLTCGVTRPTQYRYENGQSLMDSGYLVAAAEAGVDIGFVLLGQRREAIPSGRLDSAIQGMQEAADSFYRSAVQIGIHPFIEFAGLMNEYISSCREAANSGIDFTLCNTHTGQHLPLHAHQVDYINEKLECIFTGRSVVSAEAVK